MSVPPETMDANMDNPTAQQAVKAFLDVARQHLDDRELAIALVSTGAALMAATQGSEPAIAALRRAIKTLRKGEQE